MKRNINAEVKLLGNWVPATVTGEEGDKIRVIIWASHGQWNDTVDKGRVRRL